MSNKLALLGSDTASVNQILPHKNKWAWDLYIKGVNNHWVPSEVPMADDVKQWKSDDCLSEDEKLLVRRCLGFFAGGESLVSNNLLLNIFRYVQDAECRQYIARQVSEEAVHNHTIVYICDSLNLDTNEVYEAYANIPSIKAKDDFLMSITKDIHREDFNINTIDGKRELLSNIITYYIVCEGTLFYSGFAMLLALGRQKKMQGISKQIQFTIRDEALHVNFGIGLVNAIKNEYPELWNDEFANTVRYNVSKAVELEIEYAKDVLPRGILGLNSDMFVEYMQYIGDMRLKGIGLKEVFGKTTNPFGWLSESVEIEQCGNFFETTIDSYQHRSALKDDF